MSINSDSSIAIIDDIEAYDLDEDELRWKFCRLLTTHLSTKSNITKSVMNPALAYILENSGLTKEQILKIVKVTKIRKSLKVALLKDRLKGRKEQGAVYHY